MRCEGIGDIDLILTFAKGNDSTIMGIESKFDHELTKGQVGKELQALEGHGGGHLVVVLPEVIDAPELPDLHVVAWAGVLGTFRDSRLTQADIGDMPLSKRRVERLFTGADFRRYLTDPGWLVEVERNGTENRRSRGGLLHLQA